MAVQAMKAGAHDFMEKPIRYEHLMDSIKRIFDNLKSYEHLTLRRDKALFQLASLTSRQHEVMRLVLEGQANKNIAATLKISQRTVEHHRASIMQKTGTKSIPELVRLTILARGDKVDGSELSLSQ